jgi:hypothetical protein
MKTTTIFILLFLPFIARAEFSSEPCDSAVQDEIGMKLLKCNLNTFHNWKIKFDKQEMVCNAVNGYKFRRYKRTKCLLGTGLISGACFAVGVGITMAGDGGSGLSEKQYNAAFAAISGAAVINAAIWMVFYFKDGIVKTNEEKELIKEYKNTKINEQNYYYKPMQSVSLLSIEF